METKNENTENVITKEQKAKMPIIAKILIAVVAVLVVILALSILSEGKNAKNRQVNDLISLAQRYLNDMEYEEAIATFEQVIAIDPKVEDAYLGLADVYVAMAEDAIDENNYEEAKSFYEEALEVLDRAGAYITSKAITDYQEDIEDWIEELQDRISQENEISTEPEEQTTTEAAGETEEPEMVSTDSDLSLAQVGDIVTFGTYDYPYDLDGEIPVEWDVLAVEGNRVLLISHYIMTQHSFDQEGVDYEDLVDTNWEQSEVRAWLNEEFINELFTEEEKSRIPEVTIDNPSITAFRESVYPQSEGWFYPEVPGGLENPNPCGDTVDRMFLLSVYEVESFFGPYVYDMDVCDGGEMLAPAAQAELKGSEETMEFPRYDWMTRSFAIRGTSIVDIIGLGTADTWGLDVSWSCGVRPAMWVEF